MDPSDEQGMSRKWWSSWLLMRLPGSDKREKDFKSISEVEEDGEIGNQNGSQIKISAGKRIRNFIHFVIEIILYSFQNNSMTDVL